MTKRVEINNVLDCGLERFRNVVKNDFVSPNYVDNNIVS